MEIVKLGDYDERGGLQKFTLFPKLFPELREHVLMHVDRSVMFNYSQCAEQCHWDIQKFNKVPNRLSIMEVLGHTMVKMYHGENEPRTHCFYSNESFPRVLFNRLRDWMRGRRQRIVAGLIYDKEAEKLMLDFLARNFKKLTARRLNLVDINMRKWPMGITKIGIIELSRTWKVIVRDSMIDDLMDDIREHEMTKKINFELKSQLNCTNQSKFLRSKFFKTEIRRLDLEIWGGTNGGQTVAINSELYEFIRHWYFNSIDDDYLISIKDDYNLPFVKSEILKKLSVKKISEHQVELRKSNALAEITIEKNKFIFKTQKVYSLKKRLSYKDLY